MFALAAVLVFLMEYLNRNQLPMVILSGVFCTVTVIELIKSSDRRYLWGWLTGVTILSLAFCFRYSQVSGIRAECFKEIQSGSHVCLQGKIYKSDNAGKTYRYYLKDCFLQSKQGKIPCLNIQVINNKNEYSIGQLISVEGEAVCFNRARNQGGFDSKNFYQSQMIDFKVNASKIKVEKNPGIYYEVLNYIKSCLTENLQLAASTKAAGELSGILLGDKSALDDESKELFSGGGISHILAISGLHVSMLGMGLYKRFRKLGIPYVASCGISSFILLSYGIMTGNSVSTMRAVIMCLIAFLGDLLGKKYDMLNALGLSVIMICFENPFVAAYMGFWLSVIAVVGIGVVCKGLEKIKLPRGLFFSIGIWLTTAPLSAFFFYEIPSYSILVNALVLPFMGILFLMGLVSAVVYGFSTGLGRLLMWLPEHILDFYRMVCRLAIGMPLSKIRTGHFSVYKLMLYYGLLLLMVYIVLHRAKKANTSSGTGRCLWKTRVFSLLGGICLMCFISYNPSRDFEVSLLDVGQGDAAYIQLDGGRSLFIDGGSSSEDELGKYTLLPFFKYKGLASIDYWFVSHCDIDHISGLMELMDMDYRIDNLVLSKVSMEKGTDGQIKDENVRKLLSKAQEKDINILAMEAGDRLSFGGDSITCIYPGKSGDETDKTGLTDRNDLCLSLMLCHGDFTGIFAGDLPESSENDLIENIKSLKLDSAVSEDKLAFYKVNHHGSKTSSSKAWLDYLSPDISVISCARYNNYGHPSREAVNRLESAGSSIYKTMECGQISILEGVIDNKYYLWYYTEEK